MFKTSSAIVVVLSSCVGCTSHPAPRSPTIPPPVPLALIFEQNAGQIVREYDYLTHTAAYDAAFHARGVSFVLKAPTGADAAIVGVEFKGARAIHPTALAPLAARVNYLRGSSERNWIRNVPTFERVQYPQLYPGVDLVFYGTERQLEYDFVVAPHADPARIALRFDGVDSVHLNADGELVVSADGKELVQKQPLAFQQRGGTRTAVDASYEIAADGVVTMKLGPYDRTRPLTIDPMIVMSRRFGGTIGEAHGGVAFAAGALYLAGRTCSTDFPTLNAIQPSGHVTATTCDAFITKMTGDGRALVYSTYFGGSGMDRLDALAVDASGAAYIVGNTLSTDFPTTAGAFDRTCGNNGTCGPGAPPFNTGTDGFVSKISADGSRIVYSTYIGGGASDFVIAIAVNSGGEALITGETSSTDYPTTAGAVSRSLRGVRDAFITKLSADGASVVYSTYFGGSGYTEAGFAAAFDAGGNAWIAGQTDSTDMPVMGAFQPSLGNAFRPQIGDAFIVKLTPSGALALSTYFGGDGSDFALGLALDVSGVYVVGRTYSSTTPGVAGARDVNAKESAGFVAQLASDGSHVIRTQLLDGRFPDGVSAIAIARPSGSPVIHVAGNTASPDFPVSADAFQKTIGQTDAGGDLFYATFRLDAGDALAPRTYATLFGAEGSGGNAPDLAIEGSDGVFLVASADQTFPLINTPLPNAGTLIIAHLQPRERWTESVPGEVHLYAADSTVVGTEWSLVADSSAADGRRATNVDRAAAKIVTPVSNPSSYVEFTFDANAGTAYRLWIRGKATNNSYSNDSVFAQFSDSVDASGNPLWRIGSASGTPVILEDCIGCGVHGWGWNDNGYGAGVLGPTVRFASSGRHTLRFQAREDGLSIDQVVLSSAQHLSAAPGLTKDDTTVLKRTAAATPPSGDCVAGEVVIHMTGSSTTAGTWTTTSDSTAASGIRMFQPDAGAPKVPAPQAAPANYFEKTFAADANTDYRLWIRGKAQNNYWGNDSVFVQFGDSQAAGGAAQWRINSSTATTVNLEDCSGCGVSAWGWQDNGWGVGVMGPLVQFSTSGTHTIRVQTREDGLSIDQIVLSSGKYLTAAPGSLRNDTTILPACPAPPLR